MVNDMNNNIITNASNPIIDGKAPHLKCTKQEISDIVLLPGDPARVKMVGSLCESFDIIAENREYTVGVGKYNNIRITVCSTGIGASSTEIAVLELIELGAKALIRIGGTGVLRKDIQLGDLIINTGAVRRGGSSNFYAPIDYPAVASYEVIQTLVDACKKNNQKYHLGISGSVGSFFAGQGRKVLGKDFNSENVLNEYINLNVLNLEMESETIMTLGSIFGVMTGSICAVHANRITDEWLVNFEQPQFNMCKTVLDACVDLSSKL